MHPNELSAVLMRSVTLSFSLHKRRSALLKRRFLFLQVIQCRNTAFMMRKIIIIQKMIIGRA